jgi:hypothetical protein
VGGAELECGRIEIDAPESTKKSYFAKHEEILSSL